MGVVFLALGAFVSAASAEPLSMTFTEDRANVGLQLSDDAMFEAPDTAPFAAQIGPAGESITEGDLQVPQFSTEITTPIVAEVTVDFDIGTIAGSFIQGTGALTLTGEAGGTLTAHGGTYDGKECTVSTTPSPLTLSTTGNSGGASPRSGVPFTHGLTGAGAIAGQWSDMHAAPIGGDTVFCEDVEDQIGGPGGIWLYQEGDVTPPSAPQLTETDPAAPGGLSRTPRVLGTAEAGSTVRVFAGSTCGGVPIVSGGAAELNSPGLQVAVPEGTTTAVFSATATDPAGNTSACSAPISYSIQHGDPPPPPPPPTCIVPKLAGRTLARAKAALAASNCKLGTVNKQKRRKGKGWRQLVVKSSNPQAGARLTGGKVDLTLGPKPRKAQRATRVPQTVSGVSG